MEDRKNIFFILHVLSGDITDGYQVQFCREIPLQSVQHKLGRIGDSRTLQWSYTTCEKSVISGYICTRVLSYAFNMSQ